MFLLLYPAIVMICYQYYGHIATNHGCTIRKGQWISFMYRRAGAIKLTTIGANKSRDGETWYPSPPNFYQLSPIQKL